MDPIILADDFDLFLTHTDISYLFETANLQLEGINQRFISTKLLLNVCKTKCSFFHKPNKNERYSFSIPFTKTKKK